MTPSELFLLRLYRQGLLQQSQSNLVAALTTTIGIQAQQQGEAQINLGLRVAKLQVSDLNRLYQENHIVRSWAQRWTHQLMPLEDWQLVTAARANEQLPKAYYLGKRELVLKLAKIITQELTKNKLLPKSVIDEIIKPYLPAGKQQTNFTYAVLQTIVAQGLAYFDPATAMRKYVLVAAEATPPLTVNAAIEKLVLRYLTGFGPATIADFSKWAGIKISQVRPSWAKVVANLTTVEVGQQVLACIDQPDDELLDNVRQQLNQSCLVAARFDACMTGYVDKQWLVPKRYEQEMWSKNGILMAPLIVRGTLIGHWLHRTTSKGLVFTVKHWQKLANADKELIESQLKRVAYFLEQPIAAINYQAI